MTDPAQRLAGESLLRPVAEETEHLMAGFAGLAQVEMVEDVNEDPYPAQSKSVRPIRFLYSLVQPRNWSNNNKSCSTCATTSCSASANRLFKIVQEEDITSLISEIKVRTNTRPHDSITVYKGTVLTMTGGTFSPHDSIAFQGGTILAVGTADAVK